MAKLQSDIKIITTTIADKPTSTPTPSPATEQLHIFSAPPPTATIKDPNVRNVINKAFPGSQLVIWEHQDTEGVVAGGNSSTINVWIIQKDNNYFLLDIQDKVGIEEIATAMRIGKLFTSVHADIPLGCVMVTKKITKQATTVANACKIKLLKL